MEEIINILLNLLENLEDPTIKAAVIGTIIAINCWFVWKGVSKLGSLRGGGELNFWEIIEQEEAINTAAWAANAADAAAQAADAAAQAANVDDATQAANAAVAAAQAADAAAQAANANAARAVNPIIAAAQAAVAANQAARANAAVIRAANALAQAINAAVEITDPVEATAPTPVAGLGSVEAQAPLAQQIIPEPEAAEVVQPEARRAGNNPFSIFTFIRFFKGIFLLTRRLLPEFISFILQASDEAINAILLGVLGAIILIITGAADAYYDLMELLYTNLFSFYRAIYYILRNIKNIKLILRKVINYFLLNLSKKFPSLLNKTRFNYKPNPPPPPPPPILYSKQEKKKLNDNFFSKYDFIKDILIFLSTAYSFILRYLDEGFSVLVKYLYNILLFLSNCIEIIRIFIHLNYFYVYEIIRIIIEIIISIFS